MKLIQYTGYVMMCALLLLVVQSRAQLHYVSAGEYFVDVDPGVGLATPLNASDGSFNDVWEEVNATVASQPVGFHTIGIRLKDGNGIWGSLFTKVIVVENLLDVPDVKISAGEFFVDSDPGEGNGTPMVAFDGNFNDAFETVQLAGISIPLGIHTLNVRVMGADGSWSNTFQGVISVDNPLVPREINITQAEIFVDSDPGEGNATPVLAFDGNFNDAFEMMAGNLLIPTVGIHTLNLRILGKDGAWSNLFKRVISVDDVLAPIDIRVSSAEFFWDTDPGEGLGNAMVAFDGNFNDAFEQAVAGGVTAPGLGSHLLGMRIAGADGSWSNVIYVVVTVENLLVGRQVKLSSGEYFWDNDPGEGNGSPFIAADGNFNGAFEQVLANNVADPGLGSHTLGMRVLGANGDWSNVLSVIITVEELLTNTNPVAVTMAEYFFDADPGEGNGNPLLAADGNYNSAFENVVGSTNSALLPTGLHILNVRMAGMNGTWSPAKQSVIYVDPCQSSPVVTTTPSGSITICPEDSLLLTATGGLMSYQWFSGLNQVGSEQTLWVDSAAFYRVIGFDNDGCPGTSPNVQITEENVPANIISPAGPISFCTGGSIALTAGSGFAQYLWNNGETTQSIAVNTSGNYSCVATTASGCTRTSDPVAVDVYSAPPAPVISPSSATVCIGDDVVLTSDYATNIVWNTAETTQSIVAVAGNYSVTYTDPNGCSSTGYATVALSDAIASINASANQVWLPASLINFTSNTTGTITSYLWDFGDGNTSTSDDPSHTYTTSGFYTVSLTVEDSNGCTTQENYPFVITVWEVFPTEDVSLPINTYIYGATWLSSLIGYVTLPNGQLCYTTDGGLTWTPVVGCGGEDIQGITYSGDANDYCLYTYGNNGSVYISCNGAPFTSISPGGLPPGTNFYGGYWSGGYGYFFGSNNTICYYYNGVWYSINPGGVPFGTTWYGGWYYGGYLYAYGSGGYICYYYNGSWYPAGGGGGGFGYSFYGGYYSAASNCAFAVGSGGVVCVSYDGGLNWSPVNTGFYYTWYDCYINGNTVILVGEGGAICISNDGGLTWTLYSIGSDHTCTGMSANGCFAYITTDNGGVFQFPLNVTTTAPVITSESTVVCPGNGATLSVVSPRWGSNYVWSNGAVGTIAVMSTAGSYTVTEYQVCDTLTSNVIDLTEVPGDIYYRDNDNDGYGDASVTQSSCVGPPAGYVTDNTDCNDYNNEMYPGAPPTGDGVDNDCNGVVEGDEIYCPYDLNNDNVINTTDLLLLMGYFGAPCQPGCPGDFTNDGVINVSDLLLYMGYFGTVCN